MGSADIVPGVSGGTMALIVGIYTRLINAIKSFGKSFFLYLVKLKWRKALSVVHWKFLLMLFSGIISALLFFTKVVPLQVYMFTDPELIYGLFFGLIVGSVFVLAKALDTFGWTEGMLTVIGALLGFWIVTLVPTDTPESAWYIFLSGSIAICAMILPGISGSYILLILQKYDFILSEFGRLGSGETVAALVALAPFVAGAVVGLALFSRLLSWLLDRFETKTLVILIGFLVGTLYIIWPYQERDYTEIISEVEVVAYDHPKVTALRENPADRQRPEYQRLGETVNPDAPDHSKEIELLTVKRKLIHSEPFVPYITVEGQGTDHFRSGIIGMVIGLVMVVGLDYLRDKN